MSTPTHTLKKCMQVLFVVLFFLAPASISVSDTLEVSVSPNTVHAQGAADRYSDSRTAAAKSGETEGLAAAVGSAITSKLADLGAPIVQAGVNFGGQFLLMIGSAILYLGGTVFDWVMKLFVVDFAIWVKSPEIWSAITSTWSIIRDVCNLVFIFGFIYIGISTILSPDSASMKRFLAKIVVGAILINFSLYFTQVIIDFSNYTAVAVYNAIDPSANKSIASAIKSYLGTDQAFFNIKGDNLATLGKDWAKGASYYFLVCIFLMVAGLTLLIAAFHLLARFIELLLLMILSPLYFASQVFPQTEKYAGKMMGKLISSAFYAPVYLLLLYLVLTMANVFSQKLQGDFVATLVQGDVSAAAVIVNYCIIIGLMWSAIHLGKTMSVTGGDIAIKWGTEVRKGAQGYMGRGALRVTTVNWAAKNLNEKEEKLRNSSRWRDQFAAGMLRATGVNAVAKATRDMKYGGSRSLAEVDKEDEARDKKRTADRKTRDKDAIFAENLRIIENSQPNTPERQAAEATIQREVLNSSAAELQALLKRHRHGSSQYNAIVAAMSHQQYEKLIDEQDEEKFADENKDDLRTTYENVVQRSTVQKARATRRGGATPPADVFPTTGPTNWAIGSATINELGVIGYEAVLHNARHLTASQMDDIKNGAKTGKPFVQAQYDAINNARRTTLENLTDVAEIRLELQFRNADDLAKMPDRFLSNAARIAPLEFSVNSLKKIVADNSSIGFSTQQDIIRELRRASVTNQGTFSNQMRTFLNSQPIMNTFP